VYLEVRQSNYAAQKLYHSLGFEVIGVRPDYYASPVESGIVMKFLSC
jgi:ribosomal-protein-alanine N-acetyltransferase